MSTGFLTAAKTYRTMTTPCIVHLLAPTDGDRGDLFTRLTKDLFFALGYDGLRLNVAKSGCEIDIQGQHRHEPRRVLAECKAHARKMGGAELNKFFGVLARERNKSAPKPVAGYFVSLGGFTETGVEQEAETGIDRLVLLDAQQVIAELERSRVVIGHQEAVERAGRCAHHAGLQDATLDGVEFLGHNFGYVWAIFYACGKVRTHFALIHADGTPLAVTAAEVVLQEDRAPGGLFRKLAYLSPVAATSDRAALAARALAAYRHWLGEECGYIQLDGLPADTDLSATKMKLEKLFVPLNALLLDEPRNPETPPTAAELLDVQESARPIGEILGRTRHLAILAAPGGGKSTLLKRLAGAYAFRSRHSEVTDNLPIREWLPLLMRCRELRERAHRPILELLDDLPRHAGLSSQEAEVFRESLHECLRVGNAVLLVDGLDEISEEGARQTFANHLRTFVAMFPQAALVLTSREAGFRLVAGVVASACRRARLAPLVKEDVERLCTSWHVEVVGDTERVRSEAYDLAQTIWNNGRIRPLAENPLLLTTLLVVKRWIGELPRSRAALYREAIRVLIRTWNVEGYAPLDEDETLAQLSFVACRMMEEGMHQIGRKALVRLLQRARQELEAELQFARISPHEFVERIEYRSSLLMQAGHAEIDNELQPIYEFRHLTFQEYLTARGYVEEQYPDRNAGHSVASILEQHFKDERWYEVIPIATVLAGRKADEIMRRLTAACSLIQPYQEKPGKSQVAVLAQCLLDEVQVTGTTLRDALRQVGRHWREEHMSRLVTGLRRGKLSALLKEVAEHAYFNCETDLESYSSLVCQYEVEVRFNSKAPLLTDVLVNGLVEDIERGSPAKRLRALLLSRWLAEHVPCFKTADEERLAAERFTTVRDALARTYQASDPPMATAACQALIWLGGKRLANRPPAPELIQALYRTWRDANSLELARAAAWALSNQPLLPRDSLAPSIWGDCDAWLRKAEAHEDRIGNGGRDPALVVSWYRRAPWANRELADKLANISKFNSFYPTAVEMLESLGADGQRVLRRLN